MKIFGIGLNKTGTTTMGVCLEILGYTVKDCDLELTRSAARENLEPVYKVVEQYDAFQDWPWPLLYRELDQHFPGSKFILTTRLSSEKWFESLCNHAERTGPTEYRKLVYGYEMPHQHKRHHIEYYEHHNNSVREYFNDRKNDFLEVCWENGTGWEQLSPFLGHEVLERDIPHANKGVSPTKAYLSDMKNRIGAFFQKVVFP